MRALIQRVSQAQVEVDGEVVGRCGRGLVVLLGVGPTDTEAEAAQLWDKMLSLRIFDDGEGVMNLSVTDVGGDVIVVSQFTLMASTRKGNRPSYIDAAGHGKAIPLYEAFCRSLSDAIGRQVGTGQFGADMQVALVNDGPVTICIDSKNK